MSGVTALRGASSPIRSVQRGTIAITGATSNTATIAAVDTPNARLRLLGWSYGAGNGSIGQSLPNIVLTNSTTITATVTTSPGADTLTVSYEIIEYAPGVVKSIQRGTITGLTTATIAEVNPAKSELDWLGATGGVSGVASWVTSVRIALTNGTTVTSAANTANSQVTSFQVVEWF